jgi:hypothetical protein
MALRAEGKAITRYCRIGEAELLDAFVPWW